MRFFSRLSKKSESEQGKSDGVPTGEISMDTTAVMAADSEQPTGPADIILHFVRHAEAYNNDLGLTYRQRIKMHDPLINHYGVLQCANLCMSFARMDKVTHILTSPSQRAIMTASHAFRPITDRGSKLILIPQLREIHGTVPCNQGSQTGFLRWQHAEIRKTPINFEVCKAQKGWERIDYTPTLDTHVPETRQMIYNMAKEFIQKGELNSEGNVELLVVGHAGMLGALMGLDNEERENRPWGNLEIRTFQWFPDEDAEAEGEEPWTNFEEVVENNMAHIRSYSCPTKSELRKKGWSYKEIATAEAGLRLRLARDKEDAKRDKRDAAKHEARAKVIATETPEQRVKREAKEEKQNAKELAARLKKWNADKEERKWKAGIAAEQKAKKDKKRAKRAADEAAGIKRWRFQLFTGENFMQAKINEPH